jgi:hypothetical protein
MYGGVMGCMLDEVCDLLAYGRIERRENVSERKREQVKDGVFIHVKTRWLESS